MNKIEIGKTYKTRGGKDVIIDAVGCKLYSGATVIGRIIDDNGKERVWSWLSNGRIGLSASCDNDIIFEPERKSLWINWYAEEDYEECNIHESRKNADKEAADIRTHILEIIIEDGNPVDVKIHKVITN